MCKSLVANIMCQLVQEYYHEDEHIPFRMIPTRLTLAEKINMFLIPTHKYMRLKPIKRILREHDSITNKKNADLLNDLSANFEKEVKDEIIKMVSDLNLAPQRIDKPNENSSSGDSADEGKRKKVSKQTETLNGIENELERYRNKNNSQHFKDRKSLKI